MYGYLVTDFSTFLNLIIGIIRTTHFTVKIKIKINKKIKKPFSFKYRTETGCNEVTFGDCNLDVGGVLGTLYNLSVGKICTYFMLYYRSCWMGSFWDREMLITIINLNIFTVYPPQNKVQTFNASEGNKLWKSYTGLISRDKFDNNNQLTTLSVIPLSSTQCTC